LAPHLLWLLALLAWLVAEPVAAGDDKEPHFVDRTWFLFKGGPVQTYRTTEVGTRGGPISRVFKRDGAFEAKGPDRRNLPGDVTGTWRSDPSDPSLVTVEIPGQTIKYRIVQVSEDELQLEEVTQPSRPSSPQ